jgi:hypothetical protein
MSIIRVVPDIQSEYLDESREFYVGLLGFTVATDMGWIMTFASPTHPTAQLTVMRHDASSQIVPQVTVQVADVDAIHAQAVRRGVPVVYPLDGRALGRAPLFRPRPERRRPEHHVPPSREQEAQREVTSQEQICVRQDPLAPRPALVAQQRAPADAATWPRFPCSLRSLGAAERER